MVVTAFVFAGRFLYFSHERLCLLSRSDGKPRMKTCSISVVISSGSPSVTMTFPTLPTSREPNRSDTPRIRAGPRVMASSAASCERPHETELAAS